MPAARSLSGEGLFLLKLSRSDVGSLPGYAAIWIDLAAGEAYVVDTRRMVAFDAGMGNEIRKAGNSWETAMLGGEGPRGPGHWARPLLLPGAEPGRAARPADPPPRQNSN